MAIRTFDVTRRITARHVLGLILATVLIAPTAAILQSEPALAATGGDISTIAGNGTAGYSGDGNLATGAELNFPKGVAVDSEGNQIIVDSFNDLVRVVAVSASNPGYLLSGCSGSCPTGSIWTVGDIYTIAGTGTPGYNGDGIFATTAQLGDNPTLVSVDPEGNPVIADFNSSRVRVVAVSASNPGYPLGGCSETCAWTHGYIYTIAGTGTAGYNGDGMLATNAELDADNGVALDAEGNVYIADSVGNRVRVVAVSPTNPGLQLSGCSGTCTPWTQQDIYTIAGDGPTNTNGNHPYNGDGISATGAQLNYPNGVGVDPMGNVLIADSNDNRARVVAVSASNPGYPLSGCPGSCPTGSTWTVGFIYTIAGTGTAAYNGDGQRATSAEIAFPIDVLSDAQGNAIIADTNNSRVRVVAVSGSNPGYLLGGCSGTCTWSVGNIYTIVGDAIGGYNGDGIPATSAEINTPNGIAVDREGDIFVADYGNSRVREVTTLSVTETLESPSPINLGSHEAVSATIHGNPVGGAPTGSVVFYVCAPPATSCNNVSYKWRSPRVTVGTVSGDNATFTLPAPGYPPTSAGQWCFAAYYTSDEPAVYSGGNDPGSTDGCFTVDGSPPVSITAAGGTPQSDLLNSPLGQDLVVSVTDQNGNPVAGTAVQFTVNGSANGASGSFSAAGSTCSANGASSPSATEYFALTDSAGYARVPASCFTTNGRSGSYYVTADPTAGPTNATTTFGLSNTAGTSTPCSVVVTTDCTNVIDAGSIPGSLGLSFTSIPDYARPSGGCTVANAESTQDATQDIYELLNAIPPGNDAKPVEVNFDAGMCYVLDGTVYMRGLQHVILNGNGATFVQVPGETVSLTVGGGTTAQGVVTPGQSFVSDDSVHLTQAYHYNGTNQAIPVTGHGIPAGTFVGTVVGTTAGATYPYIAGFTLVNASGQPVSATTASGLYGPIPEPDTAAELVAAQSQSSVPEIVPRPVAPYCGSSIDGGSTNAIGALNSFNGYDQPASQQTSQATSLPTAFMWFVEGGCHLEIENMNMVGASDYSGNNLPSSAIQVGGAQDVLITGNSISHPYGDCVTVTGLDEPGNTSAAPLPQSWPSANVTISDNMCNAPGRDAFSPIFAQDVTVGGTTTPTDCTMVTWAVGNPATGNCVVSPYDNGIDIEADGGNVAPSVLAGGATSGQVNMLIEGNNFYQRNSVGGIGDVVSAQTTAQLQNFTLIDNSVQQLKSVFSAKCSIRDSTTHTVCGTDSNGNYLGAYLGHDITISGNTGAEAPLQPENGNLKIEGMTDGLVSLNTTPMCDSTSGAVCWPKCSSTYCTVSQEQACQNGSTTCQVYEDPWTFLYTGQAVDNAQADPLGQGIYGGSVFSWNNQLDGNQVRQVAAAGHTINGAPGAEPTIPIITDGTKVTGGTTSGDSACGDVDSTGYQFDGTGNTANEGVSNTAITGTATTGVAFPNCPSAGSVPNVPTVANVATPPALPGISGATTTNGPIHLTATSKSSAPIDHGLNGAPVGESTASSTPPKAVSCTGVAGSASFNPPLSNTSSSASEMAMLNLSLSGCSDPSDASAPTKGIADSVLPLPTNSCTNLSSSISAPTDVAVSWDGSTGNQDTGALTLSGVTGSTSGHQSFSLGGTASGDPGATLVSSMTQAAVSAACGSAAGLPSLKLISGTFRAPFDSPPVTVPATPFGVQGLPGNQQVTVSWGAPTTSGGYPITGYTVTASPGGSTCSTTGATTCVVTGLTNGTPYAFTVAAVSAVGHSEASPPSTPVTPTPATNQLRGDIYTTTGTGTATYAGDGSAATGAKLNFPKGVAVDGEGNQLVVDNGNNRVRVIAASAANPGYLLSGCSGPCTWTPGDIYTIAGTGTAGYNGDGISSTSAEIDDPALVAVDTEGNPLLADFGNNRVRVLAVSAPNPGYPLGGCSGTCTWTQGDIYTVAGTGTSGYTGDGVSATSAELDSPNGVSLDAAGNLYVADTGGNRVRVVAVSASNPGYSLGGCSGTCTWTVGDIYTIAGDGPAGGFGGGSYNGDGIPATGAALNWVNAAVQDAEGNVILTDSLNNRVRVVAVSASNPGYPLGGCSGTCTWTVGDIYTIAGTGTAGYTSDGVGAISAEVDFPVAALVDGEGNPLITDTTNDRTRVLAVSASNPGYPLGGCSGTCTWTVGDIYTIAGTGTAGYNGDNLPAPAAELDNVNGITLDAKGSIYLGDTSNNRVREVVMTSTVPSAPGVGSVATGNGLARVAFTAPSNDGGSPILAYTATCASSNGGVTGSQSSGSSPISVPSLTNGKRYTCEVSATNAVGTSASSAASASIVIGAPAPPTAVSAVKVASGQLKVTFSPGANNGATTTSYTATCTSTNGGVTGSASKSASPVTVTGLTTGKTYRCTVTGTNARGVGRPSSPSAGVTP